VIPGSRKNYFKLQTLKILYLSMADVETKAQKNYLKVVAFFKQHPVLSRTMRLSNRDSAGNATRFAAC